MKSYILQASLDWAICGNICRKWQVTKKIYIFIQMIHLPASRHRFRENCTSSIDSLENVLQVNPTRNFLDQDRRQTLWSKFFMHTQKVDLYQMMHTTYFYQSVHLFFFLLSLYCSYVLSATGIPLIKATSFLFAATRTPTSHDCFQLGGCNALLYRCVNFLFSKHCPINHSVPFQEFSRIIKSKLSLVILNIV